MADDDLDDQDDLAAAWGAALEEQGAGDADMNALGADGGEAGIEGGGDPNHPHLFPPQRPRPFGKGNFPQELGKLAFATFDEIKLVSKFSLEDPPMMRVGS